MSKSLFNQKMQVTIITTRWPTRLTYRDLFNKNELKDWIKVALLWLYNIIINCICRKNKIYGGHYAVTRSLIDGLRKNPQVIFNINPAFRCLLYENVIVLSDPIALEQVLSVKKLSKRVKKILAGPNIVHRSNEKNNLLERDGIFKVVVPSSWVAKSYEEDLPSLKGKIVLWAAGVNEEFWKPQETEERNVIIIYYKNGPIEILNKVIIMVSEITKNYKLIKYGEYKQIDYKLLLNNSKLMIYISLSESQGIALTEAWSMGVATYVWKMNQQLEILGRKYSEFSPAPYLNEELGMFWNDIKELKEYIIQKKKFSTRHWVLQNMTDTISAKNLLDLFKNSDRVYVQNDY